MNLRTLNRRCAGCVYGRYADKTDPKLADLNLRPGDFHPCHRDVKVRADNPRVCRGFLDQHPLGRQVTVVGEDNADAVDHAWEAAIYAQHREELLKLARSVAREVRRGVTQLTVSVDGKLAEIIDVETLAP
jgi:hypothetical protein